jgi:hypothetical protein
MIAVFFRREPSSHPFPRVNTQPIALNTRLAFILAVLSRKHFLRSTSLIRNATIRKNSIFGLRGVGRPFFGRRACRVFASMSSRADVYRQRAAAAKMRASQAKDLSVKKAFEEVARGWLVLAEQMEWMDRQRSTDEENDRSLC